MKLWLKLALSFAVIIVVMSATIALFSIQREIRNFEEELKKQGALLVNTLADESKDSFIIDKFVRVMDYIYTVSKQEYVVYALVADIQGNIRAHSEMDKIGQIISKPLFHGALKSEAFIKAVQSNEGEHIYDIAVPVIIRGDMVGIAQIGYSMRSIQISTARAKRQIIVITIICIVFGILFAFILSRRLVKPIIKLKEGAHAIAKGNFDITIDVKSEDEIGELSKAFNQMAIDLKTFQDKLIIARDYTDSILKSMAEILLVVDHKNKIKGFNKAALNLLGYTEDELIEQPLEKVLPEGGKAKLEELIDKNEAINYETYYETKNGKKVHVLLSAAETPALDGALKDLILTAADITKQKLLQDSLIESQEQLRTLSSKILETQEQERKKISMEIHDDLGQILTAALLDIAQARKSLSTNESETQGFLDRIQVETEKALQRARSISAVLRPGVLDHLGLKAAVESFLDDIRERTGMEIVEEMELGKNDFSEPVAVAVYRLLQEAITNIIKYSKANKVIVILQSDHKALVLSIIDDGVGFDPKSPLVNKGIGLLGMKERTEWLGGTFRVESALGQGTKIFVEIPLTEEKP
ncbi:MAG: HAMP domain-containing protein [Desulfobacterales bacterium]|nr:HAMP domain-containing protein [Desulfobacterales bacterium]